MLSIVEQLALDAEAILLDLKTLIFKHSSLHRARNPHVDGIVFLGVGDYDWLPLESEGKQLQSKLHLTYEAWLQKVRLLLATQHPSHLNEVNRSAETLDRIIGQVRGVYEPTLDPIYSNAQEEIRKQVQTLRVIYDPSPGARIFVPDTNALITNPTLEDWCFQEASKFEILLLPTVLSELDELKVAHRNQDVRDKANGIIRRIKGYRSRGRLIDGVPLRRNVSTLRTTAREPNFSRTLEWLDPNNLDDRIIAAFLEVIVEHPHSSTILVTADINMQNKAEYIGLPYVEPPEPISLV